MVEQVTIWLDMMPLQTSSYFSVPVWPPPRDVYGRLVIVKCMSLCGLRELFLTPDIVAVEGLDADFAPFTLEQVILSCLRDTGTSTGSKRSPSLSIKNNPSRQL